MTRLLVDTSVVIKWFHVEGEAEVLESRAIRAAHLREDLQAHVIELAFYEVGNVLIRALQWAADDVADQLHDLEANVGPPLVLTLPMLRDAALIAGQHPLSFYDASWAAAAVALETTLVSADRRLLDEGLAESPSAVVRRMALPMPPISPR